MPPASPKMDSTPPNRQHTSATTQITPPSFGMDRGPSMERAPPMGHTPMGHPGMMGGRPMFQQQNYGHRYPMQYVDYSKQNQYNRNHNHYNGKRGGYHNNQPQYNNMSNNRGQGEYYRGDTNMHQQRDMGSQQRDIGSQQRDMGSQQRDMGSQQRDMKRVPEMQNNHRPMERSTMPKPQKVSNSSQVSFSPPSAETFSPTSDSPSHSSPPGVVQQEKKDVNNSRSSYGSHEDTLTYEPHEAEPNFLAELENLQQHAEHVRVSEHVRPPVEHVTRGTEHVSSQHVSRAPEHVSSQHVPHTRPDNTILRRSHSEGTQGMRPQGGEIPRPPGMEIPRPPVEMPRGAPVEMPRSVNNLTRSRSSSGQTNEVLHSYFITNGEYPDTKTQDKPFYPPPMPGFESLPPRIHQRLSEKPPPKEMDQILRNFQLPMGFPASNTGFQVPEYNADKGRIENMPANYNPMQFLSMLQHNQLMPQHPGMQIPQRQNSRYTQSPTPSEEESEEDKKINLENFR